MTTPQKHMTTAAQRFRMLAMALQDREVCTPIDAARIGMDLGWVKQKPINRTLGKWRRDWVEAGCVEPLPRTSQGGHEATAIRWTPKYAAAYGLMREHYAHPWTTIGTKGIVQWRMGQIMGLIVHHGYASNEAARKWCASLGDQIAHLGGKSWKGGWKHAMDPIRALGIVQSVYHAEERLRYFLPEDEIPIHERCISDHLLHLVREKPRTLAELARVMTETRKSPVTYRNVSEVRTQLAREGRVHTGGKGNRHASSPIFYGPAPGAVRVVEPPKPAREPEPTPRYTTYVGDSRWDEIYSGEYLALDPIETKAVRAMAVRCRDWRLGKRATLGSHKTSANDEPVRRLFLRERDDIRETRLSAMALWLSWQPEFQKATS
jgi:hypothetical protein